MNLSKLWFSKGEKMIIEAVFLSVVIGYIRKGRLSNFENITIRYWYFIIISQILQIIVISLNGSVIHIKEDIFYWGHILSYIILLIPLIANVRLLSIGILGIGTLLNFIPIALNKGKMPVYLPEGINATFDKGHILSDSTTRAYILSDIIPILKPYPLPKIISIGDIFLLIGAFLFVQYGMLNREKKLG